MREQLPEHVSLESLAGRKVILQGVCKSERLPRLSGLNELLSARDIELELSIMPRKAGLFLLQGRISAVLEMICQRCLSSYIEHIEDVIRLAAGTGAEEMDDYSAIALADAHILNIPQLIEDELIIRMPQVPMHAQLEQCDPDMLKRSKEFENENIRERKENPFVILKQLK